MRLPNGLHHPLSGQWVEVFGAIYGLKQSNAIFERDLAACLATINLVPAHEPGTHVATAPDTSVYHYQDPSDPSRRLSQSSPHSCPYRMKSLRGNPSQALNSLAT